MALEYQFFQIFLDHFHSKNVQNSYPVSKIRDKNVDFHLT